VQVIPHVTDEIKSFIVRGAGDAEVAIVEIGGTVGDIESLPFLEAVRQMGLELGSNKPATFTSRSCPSQERGRDQDQADAALVKELRGIGIQPDALRCRSDRRYPTRRRRRSAV